MKARFLLVPAIGLLMSSVVLAQSGASGTWKGEAQGRGGAQEVTLELSVDGTTVTGTFMQGQQTVEISDGMVEGNTISFKRTISARGNEFTISYSGEIDGDELTLNPTFEGGRGGGGRGGGGRGGGGRGGGQQPLTLTRQ